MKIAAYTLTFLLMVPFLVGLGFLWSKSRSSKPSPPVTAAVLTSVPVSAPVERVAGTRIITIGDTGTLEETKSGNLHFTYAVAANDGRRMELGVVDSESIVHEFGIGYAGVRSLNIRQFVGKRVTVMAQVEAKLHDEKVFEPTWAHFVLIQAHDGVAP